MNAKRIFTATRIDLTCASRNRTVLYVLLAPLALALVFRFVFPLMTELRVRLVVAPSVPAAAHAVLDRHAVLLDACDEEAVRRMVSREDEVLGVVVRDGSLALMAYGDESKAMIELAQAAVARAQEALDTGSATKLQMSRYSGPGSVLLSWKRTAFSMLALLGLFAGMFAVSFGLMEDKLQRTVDVVRTSPLSRGEYLFAKSSAAGVLTVLVSLAILPLAGASPDWPKAILIAVAAVPTAAGLGAILGLAAGSDVQLVTYVKAASLILVAPIVARLLPGAWETILWWLPTYWLGRGFQAALESAAWAEVGLFAFLAALLGALLLVWARARVSRRLGLAF